MEIIWGPFLIKLYTAVFETQRLETVYVVELVLVKVEAINLSYNKVSQVEFAVTKV